MTTTDSKTPDTEAQPAPAEQVASTTAEEKAADREQQKKEAEELLSEGPEKLGLAKGLFFGQLVHDWVFPYPKLPDEQQADADKSVAELRDFVENELDPDAIDRNADIPQETIKRLAELGVLGQTAPKELGGQAFNQRQYCQILEVLGGACSSTAVFVNAHHSIGIRGLLLFGTDEQKKKWIPPLMTGDALAAFALTEPGAGSDAGGVQTMAVPSEDGSHYTLTGEKHYITNGGIAQVLMVMARTPVPGKDETKISAFLVTPDMEGFEIVDARMEKMGIRGTATGHFKLNGVKVPKENILGPYNKGLRVALTVLDFGRTTFGASCTGAAKTCIKLATEHANKRVQFKQTLGEFELVQEKIAYMTAHAYAMEAMTYVTAGLIDRGLEDYMLETAMLKVYSTELLWNMIHDTFQIYGGAAYFCDRPVERMFRDARINQIGEGANDVLRAFIALVGMRGPGEDMLAILAGLKKNVFSGVGKGIAFTGGRLKGYVAPPEVPVKHGALARDASKLSRLIAKFDRKTKHMMVKHGEDILDRQLVLGRIADLSMELLAQACVLSRLDSEMAGSGAGSVAKANPAARYFLDASQRRCAELFAGLTDNDDDTCLAAARAALGHDKK